MEKYLIDICNLKIKSGDSRSWEEIALANGYKSGESLRQLYKKYRAKEGILPSIKIGLDLEVIELRKERIKMRDERAEMNRIIREQAKKETTQDIIRETVKELNEIKPFNVNKKVVEDLENEALLLLADWHFGEIVDLQFNKYNEEIFVDRIEKLISETIKKSKINGCKKLTIMALGDLLSGSIHVSTRLQNKENIIMQTKLVSEYLTKMIYEFALNFDEVNFYSLCGNHGRVTPSKEESLKSENFENFIPWYLKSRTINMKNVNIIDNKIEDLIIANIKGKNICGIHGENTNMSKIAIDLATVVRFIPDVVVCGHLHYAEYRNESTHVFRCGSLIGNNNFSNGIYKSSDASQTLLIINEKDIDAIYNFNLTK